jgi:hypothetical protein
VSMLASRSCKCPSAARTSATAILAALAALASRVARPALGHMGLDLLEGAIGVLGAITKVELMTEAPETRSLGFGAVSEQP